MLGWEVVSHTASARAHTFGICNVSKTRDVAEEECRPRLDRMAIGANASRIVEPALGVADLESACGVGQQSERKDGNASLDDAGAQNAPPGERADIS